MLPESPSGSSSRKTQDVVVGKLSLLETYPRPAYGPHLALTYMVMPTHSEAVVYVGMTQNLPDRWRTHRRASTWFQEIGDHDIHVDVWSSRRLAQMQEALLIDSLTPRYNVALTPRLLELARELPEQQPLAIQQWRWAA